MLLAALIAATTLLPGALAPAESGARTAAGIVANGWPAPAPFYSPQTRAVSNWRREAWASLAPPSLTLIVRFAGSEPSFVARCVRLNNYWCIKRARWDGEIGGDGEDHTAFATGADGADAAVSLLSRYYREFGRRSALAIVRRWAPATCGPVAATASGVPTPRVSTALAPRGIGGTVRARYLGRHFRGGAPRRPAVVAARRSGPALRVQPWSARARLAGRRPIPAVSVPKAVPDIAAGIGPGTRVAAAPEVTRTVFSPDRLLAESAALPPVAGGVPVRPLDLSAPPPPLCSNDETRIGNYAARIAGSVGLRPGDDLKLFAPDGTPLPNLLPVLVAMSGVELGALRATHGLVAAAIARRQP
ncbi:MULTISPECIES: hypothetical protein [Methylobacterium]|uniref:Uncharacterized protein n=2 Tax=Pseudomonadota TaxID=1224 RepID=A0ABQ4SSR4_9HYPH|nr:MULTISPECIES: hypothetical protein [Methylobacterium]PIU05089.1 MAG: hypothetical protein COT56_16605 [Methylobacterium sp. CG09_land_8_20_14_0_10_71_15]PIU11305.1 MAG: hypothetical protein COT28_20655 [Methylobacterium sp. CG08_land_8_20_14_0_20_71_15]GBU18516.1 hypothetical protein AwMethylo_27310 [Methylobacterium sp.]GJE04716.1 hypothetical protein AOPFMNJM_0006 [Methylobacterium jeotgali]